MAQLTLLVKEVNPLKQGLKPLSSRSFTTAFISVKEVNPLKQGLKPSLPINEQLIRYGLKK